MALYHFPIRGTRGESHVFHASLSWLITPSGVDATIADDSAYLSHVFGLRAAPSVADVVEVDLTAQASGNEHLGSASSGNALSEPDRLSSNDLDPGAKGSGETLGHKSVVVMRDPYQNIGIRKAAGMMEQTDKPGKLLELDAGEVRF